MEILDLFSLFTERLSIHKIEYIVTGSVASIVYGEPRLITFTKYQASVLS